jgi:hypothetical protein
MPACSSADINFSVKYHLFEAGVFDGPENHFLHQIGIDIRPEFSGFHALLDDVQQGAGILPYHGIGPGLEIGQGIAHLQQQNPGQDPVFSITGQAGRHNGCQFLDTGFFCRDPGFYPFLERGEVLMEYLVKQVFLVSEILVDQPLGPRRLSRRSLRW